jgi:hypothetical protein
MLSAQGPWSVRGGHLVMVLRQEVEPVRPVRLRRLPRKRQQVVDTYTESG